MNIDLNRSPLGPMNRWPLGPMNQWTVRMLLRLSLRFARVTSKRRNTIGLAMVSVCAQALGVLMYSLGERSRTV